MTSREEFLKELIKAHEENQVVCMRCSYFDNKTLHCCHWNMGYQKTPLDYCRYFEDKEDKENE